MPCAITGSGGTLPIRAWRGITARTIGDVRLVAEVEHLEGHLGQAGQQVRARRVVVIDPDQPVERLEDARQVRRGQRVENLGRQQAGNVVEQQDAVHSADRIDLRAQPGDDRFRQHVEQPGRAGRARA